MIQTPPPVLDVRNLWLSFPGHGGDTTAVAGLSFSVRPGQAVALVGESGCGKSSTALAIMQLLPDTARFAGEIRLDGRNIVGLPRKELRAMRGSTAAMIFQEPMTSLNPVHRIGDQIAEALRAHEQLSYKAARARALALLEQVRIPDAARRLDAYPHQLSGGQRQRVMIAMAISGRPKLLIADEPTTALDATIQAQILQLLDELRQELGMGLLLITHDLALVSRWTEDVVVMHHGEKMEQLPAVDLFSNAHHPYTRGLIGASIRLDRSQHYRKRRLPEIRVVHNPDDTYAFSLEQREPARLAPPLLDSHPVLAVKNLVVRYDTPRGPFTAVDDVSLRIAPGETLGLVGESGSGKSTLSKAVMRLVPAHEGRIVFKGEDIGAFSGKDLRRVRRDMQMVFQDPYGSLNPRHTVGEILEGPLAVHEVDDARERRKRVLDMLDRVGLPARSVNRLPHEFSGGQRQRIGIARALILNPSLVVCDEPVSALDVSVQSQILNLLVELKESLNLSYLFISHDLAVVQYISDRVVVMKDAKVVEENDHLHIWTNPRHDYTRALINAVAREQ